jgi:hypothetical protein
MHPAAKGTRDDPELQDPGRGLWKLELSILAVIVLIVAMFWPVIRKSQVHTSALDCPPPAEHEQLHIIVRVRKGRLAVDDCLYVGSEGTYRGAGR